METIPLIHKVILRLDLLQSRIIVQFPEKIFYYYPNKEDLPNNITYENNEYKPKDGFDIHKALKLNVVSDAETEAKKPKLPKKVRIKKNLFQSSKMKDQHERENQIVC